MKKHKNVLWGWKVDLKLFIIAAIVLFLGFQNTTDAATTDANSVPADANSVIAEANAIDVKNFAGQTLKAMDKVTSYQSVLSIMDFAKESLKARDHVSIDWVFMYEKPDRFAVEQTSWEENVADRWISVGRKQYTWVGSWVENKKRDRAQVNKFLPFGKYRPVLKKCKLTFAGIEKTATKEYILLKGPLDNSMKSIFPRPKGKNESEVFVSINKGTVLVAKISMRCRGTDEKGRKIDFEYRQSFLNYNKKFNIEEPIEIEM